MNEVNGSGTPITPATKEDFDKIMAITIGILIVIGITVVTLVIQYFSATQASYQSLVVEVAEQKAKVEFMTNILLQSQNKTQQINFKVLQ
ncbi:MAG: hypothetical protein AAB780_00500 [Patescibacteria group bacterium]